MATVTFDALNGTGRIKTAGGPQQRLAAEAVVLAEILGVAGRRGRMEFELKLAGELASIKCMAGHPANWRHKHAFSWLFPG